MDENAFAALLATVVCGIVTLWGRWAVERDLARVKAEDALDRRVDELAAFLRGEFRPVADDELALPWAEEVRDD